VAWTNESVLFGNIIGPGFDLVGFDFNGFSAFPADQVVMVAGSAGTVEQFAVFTLQAVGFALNR
jgi:hypothetical protein